MMEQRFQGIKALVKSIKPYGGEMSLTVLCSFVKQISMLGTVALTAYIAGLAVQGELAKHIALLCLPLAICILLRAALSFGEMWFGHDVAFRVIRNFRLSLYCKIGELAPAYTLRHQTGQLGQTLISDVEILELFLAHTFAGFIVAVIITIIVLTVLAKINLLLAGLLLAAALFLGFVPHGMKKKADAQGADVREKLADANSMMVEGVQGMREIVTLNSKERYREKNDRYMQSLYDAQQSFGRRKGTESMLAQMTVGCFTVAVMAIAATLVTSGKMDSALYPVVVVLSSMVLSPIIEVTTVAQDIGLVLAAANRVQTILSEKPAVSNYGSKTCDAIPYDISFRNVSFGYSNCKENVLSSLSFLIHQGETVVLVGHSGAGKTTCANLLLRYWDVNSGSIKLGKTDIREYAIDSLRETVSAVQQDTYLFHASIRENIRLGRPNATDEEVVSAAKAANAHEFIIGLPDGYNTITGERGFRLSGGQRQRIAIARVLLKNTPIIIFDEAVSSLDSENELYIQQTLRTQLHNKTVMMIAHRLSTIIAADRIVMLEHGQIVAEGTHQELMENNIKYQKLINNQFR